MQVCSKTDPMIGNVVQLRNDVQTTPNDTWIGPNFLQFYVQLGKPKIDEPLPPSIQNGIMTVKIGAPVYMIYPVIFTIICNVIVGEPPITINWYRNEKLYRSRINVSTAIVSDAKDGDVFTCCASNLYGCDDKTTTIYSAHNFCVAINDSYDST